MYSRNPLSMYFSEHVERILPTPHRNLDWLNHPLNQGLVGYWPLRRQFTIPAGLKAFDYSGNGNNLSINNGPVIADDATLGRMSSFDGIDDNMQAANSSVCDITTGDAALCGMFIRKSDSGGNETVLRKRDIGTNPGYALIITAGDTLQGQFNDGAGGAAVFVGTQTITVGNLYIWFLLFSRADNMTLELFNITTGSLVAETASIAAKSTSATTSQILTIGRASAGVTDFFPGYQGELKMFNRVPDSTQRTELRKLMLKRL